MSTPVGGHNCADSFYTPGSHATTHLPGYEDPGGTENKQLT